MTGLTQNRFSPPNDEGGNQVGENPSPGAAWHQGFSNRPTNRANLPTVLGLVYLQEFPPVHHYPEAPHDPTRTKPRNQTDPQGSRH